VLFGCFLSLAANVTAGLLAATTFATVLVAPGGRRRHLLPRKPGARSGV